MWSLFVQTAIPIDEIEAKTQDVYGALYEANTIVGKAQVLLHGHKETNQLIVWQRHLFAIGHEFSNASPFGLDDEVEWLLTHITHLKVHVSLHEFILPNGTQAVCELRHAAAVLQRASREIFRLSRMRPVGSASVQYVDLSSAYLFYLSVWLNQEAGVGELPAKELNT